MATHIAQENMTPYTTQESPNKFQRYRARRAAQGMKLLRVWVPNPQSTGFAEEAARQAQLLRGAPEEADALDFIALSLDSRDWT